MKHIITQEMKEDRYALEVKSVYTYRVFQNGNGEITVSVQKTKAFKACSMKDENICTMNISTFDRLSIDDLHWIVIFLRNGIKNDTEITGSIDENGTLKAVDHFGSFTGYLEKNFKLAEIEHEPEEEPEPLQEYSSADTSINSSKLPKLYNAMAPELSGKSVIDYGCGKYLDSYKEQVDFDLSGYDPFNYDHPENLRKNYDVAICSNVLNVIKEQEIRENILKTMKELAPVCMITVYEGDGSGTGRATKKDCYQLNWKAKEYRPELERVFDEVTYRKGCFICR